MEEQVLLEEKAKEIVLKHFKAGSIELIDVVLFPALDILAAKSENKIDDVMLAALKPQLQQIVKELIEKIGK